MYEAICEHQSLNISCLSQNWPEQMAYYRFLDNPRVSLDELTEILAIHCQQQVAGLHVLAISDPSEINLQAHQGRLKYSDLGVVGNNQDVGFFIHPTLVLNARSGLTLGISDVHLWSRPVNHPDKHKRRYKELPIEQKESFKWLLSAANSQRRLQLGGATTVTHIGDREADIYEEWASKTNTGSHLLIRASRDRSIGDSSKTLYAYIGEQNCQGTYSLTINTDARSCRTSRVASIAVRFAPVHLQRPKRLNGTDYPASVSLYAVEAKEIHPPAGQSPVHWRLLTTHEVVGLEQALQVIQWYSWRWRIEQLFAILKRGGLDLEATQLESVAGIQRLCLLGLGAAVRVLQLNLGRHQDTESASVVFSDAQQQCLSELAPTLEGRTALQKNPSPPLTLAWATWLIARLGGWSGYQSQRPPGISTLFHGLQQFDSLFFGWCLARAQDVYKR